MTNIHQDQRTYPPQVYANTAPQSNSTKPLRAAAAAGAAKFSGGELPVDSEQQLPAAHHLHRRLLLFFGLYALLLVALYALYAAYYFCFHQSHQTHTIEPTSANGHLFDSSTQPTQQPQTRQLSPDDSERFENKLILLERYIEILVSEVQGLNGRLREREKCDCALSCTFNGTRFAEGSSWQSQCDVCTCQSGRIMCLPQKCPTLSCDEPVLVPGQCCTSCLRSCKYNNSLIKHGRKFNAGRNKECRCYDGRIRCEMAQKADPATTTQPVLLSNRPNETLAHNSSNHLEKKENLKAYLSLV